MIHSLSHDSSPDSRELAFTIFSGAIDALRRESDLSEANTIVETALERLAGEAKRLAPAGADFAGSIYADQDLRARFSRNIHVLDAGAGPDDNIWFMMAATAAAKGIENRRVLEENPVLSFVYECGLSLLTARCSLRAGNAGDERQLWLDSQCVVNAKISSQPRELARLLGQINPDMARPDSAVQQYLWENIVCAHPCAGQVDKESLKWGLNADDLEGKWRRLADLCSLKISGAGLPAVLKTPLIVPDETKCCVVKMGHREHAVAVLDLASRSSSHIPVIAVPMCQKDFGLIERDGKLWAERGMIYDSEAKRPVLVELEQPLMVGAILGCPAMSPELAAMASKLSIPISNSGSFEGITEDKILQEKAYRRAGVSAPRTIAIVKAGEKEMEITGRLEAALENTPVASVICKAARGARGEGMFIEDELEDGGVENCAVQLEGLAESDDYLIQETISSPKMKLRGQKLDWDLAVFVNRTAGGELVACAPLVRIGHGINNAGGDLISLEEALNVLGLSAEEQEQFREEMNRNALEAFRAVEAMAKEDYPYTFIPNDFARVDMKWDGKAFYTLETNGGFSGFAWEYSQFHPEDRWGAEGAAVERARELASQCLLKNELLEEYVYRKTPSREQMLQWLEEGDIEVDFEEIQSRSFRLANENAAAFFIDPRTGEFRVAENNFHEAGPIPNVLQPSILYRFKGRHWDNIWLNDVVAIARGIRHGNDVLYSDEELSALGIEMLKREDGDPKIMQVFMDGGRVINLPGPFIVPYLQNGERTLLISRRDWLDKLAAKGGIDYESLSTRELLRSLVESGLVLVKLASSLQLKGAGSRLGLIPEVPFSERRVEESDDPLLTLDFTQMLWGTEPAGAADASESRALAVERHLREEGVRFLADTFDVTTIFESDDDVLMSARLSYMTQRARVVTSADPADARASAERYNAMAGEIYNIPDYRLAHLLRVHYTAGLNLGAMMRSHIVRTMTSHTLGNTGFSADEIDSASLRNENFEYLRHVGQVLNDNGLEVSFVSGFSGSDLGAHDLFRATSAIEEAGFDGKVMYRPPADHTDFRRQIMEDDFVSQWLYFLMRFTYAFEGKGTPSRFAEYLVENRELFEVFLHAMTKGNVPPQWDSALEAAVQEKDDDMREVAQALIAMARGVAE